MKTPKNNRPCTPQSCAKSPRPLAARKKAPSTRSAGTMRGFKLYAAAVLVVCLVLSSATPVFAAATDPLVVVNNLSGFIFGLIRAIGLILLGFGIVQIGLSLKSHDPSQRANGFLTLAGGVIITFAREILGLITGGAV